MGNKYKKEKFEFGVDFQDAILQYTVSHKLGYKALALYEDHYFTLLTHSFVAFTLKQYFRKKRRIPSKVILQENLRKNYLHRDFAKNMTEDLEKEIKQLVDKIYSGIPRDSEDILEEVIQFAQYVELKNELDNADVHDFSQYKLIETRIRKALSIGRDLEKKRGTMIVAGGADRVLQRDLEPSGIPTPYWQWNRCLNGGVLKKHALIMIMGKAKRFKTGVLINICKAWMNRKKKILYIDLENGEANISTRADQAIVNSTQEDISHPEIAKKLLKQLRKYKRLGSELVIFRLPALETTCQDIQKIVDEYRLEHGIVFDAGVVDFGDLLGAESGKKDDTERISDAYLDMKNLAERNNWDWIMTASHVNRPAVKREATKYEAEDVAKCVDKIRYLDICFGMQESPEEKEAGVMRLEVIEQRDGPRDACMHFWADIKKQGLKEFTRDQVKEYQVQSEEEVEEASEKRKRKVKDI